jgi:hypothetical protein
MIVVWVDARKDPVKCMIVKKGVYVKLLIVMNVVMSILENLSQERGPISVIQH